jgi:hydroxyacylglutathione hydrolase
VIGGKDCAGVTVTPTNGEVFQIGDISLKALYTPCHTQDSICWFIQDTTGKAVFTGDTLFIGGTWLDRTGDIYTDHSYL